MAIILAVALAGMVSTVVAVRQWGLSDDPTSASYDDGAYEKHRGVAQDADKTAVQLTEAEMKEYNIQLSAAGAGKLEVNINLPGEVVLNPDRLAHIVPRVPGVVREVRKYLGDFARAGEVMAILESRELADLKSAYLAAKERVALAEATYEREEGLWRKKISAEQDYLAAKQTLAEAKIELRSAEQKLHAVGFSEAYLAQLKDHSEVAFTYYEVIAPFDGTVIEKHITLGEVLKEEETAFLIADLSSVWVNLTVYQKDLPIVHVGQPVVVSAGHGIPEASGAISYISPLVGEETRTVTARVVLPNPQGLWRPGLFVTARVVVEAIDAPIVVPKTALESIDDQTCIFTETEDGFEPQPVTIGRADETHVEITSGLTVGQRYVSLGGFTLKAQLEKSAFGTERGD